MNWLYYLAEGNLYLSIFYLCYCLFLNNETHYTLNRAYLLFSCVAAFILPLLQVGLLKPQVVAVKPPIVTIAPITEVYQPIATAPVSVNVSPVAEASHFTLKDGLLYAYLIGLFVLLVLFTIRLYKLLQLRRGNNAVSNEGYKLIYLDGSSTAFSFFNYLFIGTKAPGAETIIKHELVHIRQKHSIDIVLVELLKVINWFNPLVYLLQNSLKTVHEYIADEQAAANEADTLAYSAFLVDSAYGISGATLTNSFFNYNLLKKRIIMLNQQRSGKLTRLKYLVAAPLCAILLGVSTLGFSKSYGWFDLAPAHVSVKRVVNSVVDAPPAITDVADAEKPSTDVRFISQPKHYVNAKGYIIDESYYTANGNKYFRTIITAPSGKTLPSYASDKDHKRLYIYKGMGGARYESNIFKIYGYKFPDVEVTLFKQETSSFPSPTFMVITKSKPFVDYIYKNTKYPEKAKVDKVNGIVILKFDLDTRGIINNPTVYQSGGHGFDEAALAVLGAYKKPIKDTVGSHTMSFVFYILGSGKQLTATDEQKKQPGYIGELAILDRVVETPKIPLPPKTPAIKSAQVAPKNQVLPSALNTDDKNTDRISYRNLVYTTHITGPVVIANNKIIYEPGSKTAENLELDADKIFYYDHSNKEDMKSAIAKWGQKAKNGVFELVGHYHIDHQRIAKAGEKVPEHVSLPSENGKKPPLYVINGKPYLLKEPLKSGQSINTVADSMITYKKGDKVAKLKWGAAADNGVIELLGHASITIE